MGWPWFLLLPLLLYGAAAATVPPLRRSFPDLRLGKITVSRAAATVALSGLAAGALLAHHQLMHPDVTKLATSLPVAAFGSVILAGVCFSVANAGMEELIFRGILYEAVAAEWGSAAAIGVTAICFGLGHMAGYPPGPVGAILAGLYGVGLGLLRWWSGGLALCVGSHICADTTIFGILVSAGVFRDGVG